MAAGVKGGTVAIAVVRVIRLSRELALPVRADGRQRNQTISTPDQKEATIAKLRVDAIGGVAGSGTGANRSPLQGWAASGILCRTATGNEAGGQQEKLASI